MGELTKRQLTERLGILDIVLETGGEASWSKLHSRGFHYMTVSAMVLQGWLSSPSAYEYRITPAGRAALKEHSNEA